MDSLVICNTVEKLKDKCTKLWWDTDKFSPIFSEEINLKEKILKERAMNKFLSDLFSHLKNCPENENTQVEWRNTLWSMIKTFGHASGFTEDEINGDFSKSLPTITHKFICSVKGFDNTIRLDKMVQALRNVWIMNILQVLFNLKVEYTPSIFAYSMLYPYTDNYLDSPLISLEDKKSINERFKSRLEGKEIKSNNSYEAALFKLVSLIEGQYPRAHYSEVYESLLCIHSAQSRSLTQQSHMTSPYESDILGISTEKGGTSVLADAYLVNGRLSEAESDFIFAYGTLLQLCDDLQDAKEDLSNEHMTIFSETSEKWPLDNITNALFDYSNKIIDLDEGFTSIEGTKMKTFLKKNLISLIFEAISQNYNLYSSDYIKNIEKYYPFRMSYTRKLYKKIKNNYSSFENIHGYSIDDVILIATDVD
ncbi:hypothetical protein K9O30_15830 [Clostridium bowmanii]|uniref:hypothetical protein n=1 Tax=Clostridium bowmanii TaxID=132925 RepID=UPI001C0E0314|nr:hypothetical protein [Clostridium bowmanii]MBU3190925.1 hypothetical protein [Clostridium bowmanii]MCA1075169.1 hypothetical protein [Clostridium bowmanii]